MGSTPFPAAAVLAILLAGCGMGRHLEHLDSLHEPKSFAHRPDERKTLDACLDEVTWLAGAEYGDPREAAGAVFLLSRAASEDAAALHRAAACSALARLAAWYGPGEPAAGPAPTEAEAGAAMERLRALPGEAIGERAALFRRLGEFRIPLVGDPGPVGYARDLRILHGTLLGVLKESRGESGTEAEEEAIGALRNLGLQVARTAVAGTILHDGDPRVRGEAAAAGATFGGADLAEVLRTAYATEGDEGARRAMVRAAAAVAARLEGAARNTPVTMLLAALEDDDRGIRFEARQGLEALAGEDLGEKPGPWLRWWAGAQ